MDFARALDRDSGSQIDTVVTLGIGGSSLGPRALYSALAQPFDQLASRSPGMPRRLFFADNIDPVTFAALLERLPPENVLWNVVTKSGGTAETCAQFLVVAGLLDKKLGADRARKHIVCTTDPTRALCAPSHASARIPCSTFLRMSAAGSACCHRSACCQRRSRAST